MEASPAVMTEWRNRVQAEYASAALTAELVHWLILLGLSPDTIKSGHQIVLDELDHAEKSLEIYLLAGGDEEQIEIDASTMVIRHAPGRPVLERALHVVADFFCCGETTARPLFRAMLEDSEAPQVREVLQGIIRDEARHSAFGWSTLDELLPLVDSATQAELKAKVPEYIERIRSAYQTPAAKQRELSPEERGWGILSSRDYAEIVDRSIEATLTPRFRQRSLL